MRLGVTITGATLPRLPNGIFCFAAYASLSVAVLLPVCVPASALSISSTDLWQNAAIVSAPTIQAGSSATNMFGGAAGFPETTNTVFADGYAANYVHHVEWQTAAAITLRSFVLFAAHDGSPRNANQRGFNRFELFAWDGAAYQSIFSYDAPALLYGNNTAPANAILESPGANVLFLGVNLLPVTASKFRAEFRQYGHGPDNPTESGPRILELDGYSTHLTQASVPEVPIPAALPLFATGLAALGLLGWRRKRNA